MSTAFRFFTNRPSRGIRWIPVVSTELLPHFTKLASDLKLARRARTEGAENRPDKDDQELDAAQREIGAAVVEGVNLLRQFLRDQLHRAKEQIQARFPSPINSEVALIEARAAIQQAKHLHRDELVNLSLEEHRKRRQIKKFRADNGLSRDASYAPLVIVPLSVLFAIIAVETAANAILFAKTNPLGYAGGAFQALLFSVVNVALGFAGGFLGLRLITHIKKHIKAFGFAVLLLAAAVGTYWNLKVAYYRDLLEHNTDTDFVSSSSAMPSIDWLSLSSIESWALLFLGLIIFVIAMIEGRGGRAGFADPYCGYRSVDIAHRDAETSYRTAKEHYRAAVRASIETPRENVRKRINDDASRVAEALEIADAAQIRTQEVRDSIGEWIMMGGSLLRLYREENEKVRTAPPPAHFRTYPSFEQIADRIPDASNVRTLAGAAERRHTDNLAALAKLETDLAKLAYDELERFLAEIDNIENHAQGRLSDEWDVTGRTQKFAATALPHLRRAN